MLNAIPRARSHMPPAGYTVADEAAYHELLNLIAGVAGSYHAEDPEGQALLERLSEIEREYLGRQGRAIDGGG